MAERMFEYEARLAVLKKKYYKKFNRVLPAFTVTKFFQLDRRIDLMMDMQLEASLPPLTQAQYAVPGKWRGRTGSAMRQAALDRDSHPGSTRCSRIMKRLVIVAAMLLSAIMVLAQTQVQRETLSVQGYQGQATVIRNHGRVLVDVQDLARITKGSLSFEEDRIILTLAPSDASEAAATPPRSQDFHPRS